MPADAVMPTVSATTDAAFALPTAQELHDRLEAYTPRVRPTWVRYIPTALLVATVGVSLSSQTWWAAMLPWLALLGLIVYGVVRMRIARRRQRRVRRAQDLATLRYHRAALRLGWDLLPELVYDPTAHGRITTIFAHLFDDLGDHDAALVALDHMLTGLPPEHPGALAMNTQRAIIFFQTDRLADGDHTLRKIRGSIEPFVGTPLHAAFHGALLVQSVRTCHFAEAVADLPDPVALFRPLGVEAGYAHGLLALCHHRLGHTDAASAAWSRATLLLPSATLVGRFPELAAMTENTSPAGETP